MGRYVIIHFIPVNSLWPGNEKQTVLVYRCCCPGQGIPKCLGTKINSETDERICTRSEISRRTKKVQSGYSISQCKSETKGRPIQQTCRSQTVSTMMLLKLMLLSAKHKSSKLLFYHRYVLEICQMLVNFLYSSANATILYCQDGGRTKFSLKVQQKPNFSTTGMHRSSRAIHSRETRRFSLGVFYNLSWAGVNLSQEFWFEMSD